MPRYPRVPLAPPLALAGRCLPRRTGPTYSTRTSRGSWLTRIPSRSVSSATSSRWSPASPATALVSACSLGLQRAYHRKAPHLRGDKGTGHKPRPDPFWPGIGMIHEGVRGRQGRCHRLSRQSFSWWIDRGSGSVTLPRNGWPPAVVLWIDRGSGSVTLFAWPCNMSSALWIDRGSGSVTLVG